MLGTTQKNNFKILKLVKTIKHIIMLWAISTEISIFGKKQINITEKQQNITKSFQKDKNCGTLQY